MKNSLFRYVCLVVALLICSFADAQQKANYKLAEKFRLLEQNPIIKYSTEVKPTFINGTDCFYYSFTTREGKKYYYVNPKKKEKRLLFDTAELLSKIAVYTKKAYSSADPYLSFTFMKDNETIRIDFDRGLYTYNIHTKALKQLSEFLVSSVPMVGPGQMALTRIPNAAFSKAAISVKAITAALAGP